MFGQVNISKSVSPEVFPGEKSALQGSFFHVYSEQRPVSVENCSVVLEGKITRILSGEKIDKNNQEEVIIRLYLSCGEDFLKKLDGLFSLFLYDHTKRKVLICNNRYQTTNCYYYQEDGQFFFSKSLKKLLQLYVRKPQPHFGSIKSFVSTGFTIPDQTQIRGVRKLLPAFWLSIEAGGIHIKNHWQEEFSFNRKKYIDLEPELDRYERIYQDGLKRFFDYNDTHELGSFLSGGHDTSFAVIQASKVHAKPIHCFTTTFPDWMWNEEEYARNIANKVGAKFHAVPFLPEDVDNILGVIKATEEPVVSVTIPMYKMGKIASDYVDTMIGGDGGDTLWGEYYPVVEFHRYIKNFPRWARKLIHKASELGVKLTDWERFWELEHVASLFTEDNVYDDFLRKLCTYRHFNDQLMRDLFVSDVQNHLIPRSILEIPFNRDNFSEALIEGKLFNGFYTYMSFFTYKEIESFGLKLYFPTINKELMDFITSLPEEWINGGSTFQRLINDKSINRRFHKKALARYLRSEEIYNRSFDIPWYTILKPRKRLLELLLKKLKNRGWYQSHTLDKIFGEFENQKNKAYELLELKSHGYRIFTLLSLEVWAMQYLDNVSFEGATLEDYLRT